MIISTSVYASNNDDIAIVENTIIKPNFTNISIFVNTFEISAYGKASVSSCLTARNIDKVRIETNLQQFKNGKWISIKSWEDSSNGTNGGLGDILYSQRISL